jgi:hypothetical protein
MEGVVVSEIASVTSSYDLGPYGVLLIEDDVVRHYSFGGQLVKQYTCECSPIMAIFHFDQNSSNTMVVILLAPALIRIFPENGDFFDIPLSFLACRIFSSSVGVVVENKRNFDQNLVQETIHSMYYVIYRPDAPYVPLYQSISDGEIISLCGSFVAILGSENLLTIGSIFIAEKEKGDSISFSQNESKMSDSFSSSRYSRSSKRSRTRAPIKRPISSPEMLANALGVSGYLESRSASPLSSARIREIDQERRGSKPIPVNSLHLSRDEYFVNDHSISTDHTPLDSSPQGNVYFMMNCSAVISLEEIGTPESVTFSRDPQGETLIHLLSPYGNLRTYRLPKNVNGIVSQEALLPLRQMDNISSITHFYLGQARRTIDSQGSALVTCDDLFGSLIAHKEVRSCLFRSLSSSHDRQMNRVELVIGLSPPICLFDESILGDGAVFATLHDSGTKKSRPGDVFSLSEVSASNLSSP